MNIMVHDVNKAPSNSISDHILDVVETFTHLGSIVATNLLLDAELNTRISKASAAMSGTTSTTTSNGLYIP